MISILETLQEYVPRCKLEVDDEENVSGNESDKDIEKDDTLDDNYVLQSVLLGGDQLSSSMARRVIADRVNSTNDIQSLKGMLPVVEDWHAKLCFLGVIILYRLNTCS